MLTININKDYYAVIETDNSRLFNLIVRSFTRTETRYDYFARKYYNIDVKYYSLVKNSKTNKQNIKVKAGLIPFLCRSLNKNNIEYKVNDFSKSINLDKIRVITHLNEKVTLRDYQISAVKAAFYHKNCCIQLPTGSGKSEVSASIIKTFLNIYNDEAVLYVVPTVALQREAKSRFNKYGIETNTEYPIQKSKTNILTYMGLIRADTKKLDYKQRDLVGCIIFDESQHLSSTKGCNIVHKFNNVRMRIGTSATPTEVQSSKEKMYLKDLVANELKVFGCTGGIGYKRSVEETIEDNFITPFEVNVIDFEMDKKYSLSYEETDWFSIKNELLKSEQRANFTAKLVRKVFTEKTFNTIALLIPEVKWSRIYMQILANLFFDIGNIKIYELHGQGIIYEYIKNHPVKLKDNEAEIAMENIRNPKIKTIFSATSFFTEGIDIPNLQALFNVGGGKSVIRVKQQLGRVMRMFKNKEKAYVYEIRDISSLVLLSQFRKRLAIYEDEYNAEIKYLNKKY